MFLLVVSLLFAGCAEPPPPLIKISRPCLGTVVEITVADKDKPRQFIYHALEQAFAEIARIENLLSRFKSGSDISRINTDAGKRRTEVSPETITLIEESIFFSRISGGAFDITVHPLLEIWGFDGMHPAEIPSEQQLKLAQEEVDYRNIEINKEEHTVSCAHREMSLDLGGIAKGYAVDRAIAVLREEGIRNALVNAGGDIYALGRRDDDNKWLIGIQHPRQRDRMLSVIELEDRAVATSGDYQRYIEIDNQQYGHIINPRTGIPCTVLPCSITVFAPDCATADALATAIFVLGPDQGLGLIDPIEDVEAIAAGFEQGKLNILLSRGLKGKIGINRE